MSIDKVVIPVAGLGTRLLPATKSQPKEMLPIGRKPIVQYVVEEMVGQGLRKFLFVTGRNKRSIEDHFDVDPELINRLSEAGDQDLLDEIPDVQEGVEFFYTRQPITTGRSAPAGLGAAVGLSEEFVGGEPFVVALGDTIIKPGNHSGLVKRMIKSHLKHQSGCTLAVFEVEPDQVSRYGIVEPGGRIGSEFFVKDLVEKPLAADAPSRFAIAARYVLHPDIFKAIRVTPPGIHGEIWLTDAIRIMIRQGSTVRCVRLKPDEARYDIGNPESYFKAFIDFALGDKRYGYLIRQYIQKRLRET